MVKKTEAETANLEKADRIHRLAIHEENIVHTTLNFFLVAESMLLLFYATILGKLQPAAELAIAVLGIALTILWIIINHRQKFHLKTVVEQLKRHCLDAREIEKMRKGKQEYGPWILAYCIPMVVLLIWVTLLFNY